jgi:acetoin utilization protein AcuB
MIDLRTGTVREHLIFAPTITTRTTVSTALRLLREHDLVALPVCEGERFLGFVWETGLLRLTPSDVTTLDVYELRDVLDGLTVSRIVKPSPSIGPEASLEEASTIMRAGRHQLLPVLDGRRFLGLLPWTAVLP